ncbi:MAG: DUF1918 domain-containing protein [Solirubrobacterales bacterium]
MTEVEMQAKVGDHIVVESETVGTPTRQGEVLEVIQGEVGVRFHVRWEDGHETTFTPSAGSVRVLAKARPKTRSKR